MDDRRVGLVIRALRRRRGWRQADLAGLSRVSRSFVSLVERGHVEAVSLQALRRLLLALDASAAIDLRWRGGEVERLLDNEHARLAAGVAAILLRDGWTVRTEVTYAEYSERGAFDILAWHARTRTLLVIEIKTELLSAEATLRKLDEKARLGAKVVLRRFGWRANRVSRLLVLTDSTTARARLRAHAELFNAALPTTGRDIRRWLADPIGPLEGRWFLRPSNPRTDRQRSGARQRVRLSKPAA